MTYIDSLFLNLSNNSPYIKNFHKKIFKEINYAIKFIKKKNSFKFVKLKKEFFDRFNSKIVGGGTNYNLAKALSYLISKSQNRSCANDTLENHKHIDMSSEPILIALLGDTEKKEYLIDCNSEIEKCFSHNNSVFVVATKKSLSTFKKVSKEYFFEIPMVKKEFLLILYLKLFEKLYI